MSASARNILYGALVAVPVVVLGIGWSPAGPATARSHDKNARTHLAPATDPLAGDPRGISPNILLATRPPVPKEVESRFMKDVQSAREKAIDFLKQKQTKAGTWEHGIGLPQFAAFEGGLTALVVVALLEAGVAPDDPAITKAVEYLAQLPLKKTYVVSLQTQALARATRRRYTRRTVARRRAKEVQVKETPDPAAMEHDPWTDLRAVLDEELSRLPDTYRAVVVLCDLEGRTRKEVALQLGVPEGTVAGRLARARAMLAKRLTGRGATLSCGALAALLAQNVATAGVPNAVVSSTIQTATKVAAGQAVATGAASVKVAALTDGVLKAMLVNKLKAVLALTLALGLVALGATALAFRMAAAQGDQPPAKEKPVNASEKPEQKTVTSERGADAKEPPVGHRFTVHLNKVAPWPRPVQCAFLGNDRILVQAGTGKLEVRDAKTGKVLQSVELDKHDIGEFCLSADRKTVAARTIADTTGTFVIPSPDVTVWDTTNWKVRGRIGGHRILGLAADGRTVLARDDDGWGEQSGKVAVWDVVDNKKLKTSPFEFKRFDAAAFSPDGKLVAVSGLNEIAYWKWREDGGKFDRLKVGRRVGALVFSPDGKFVAEGPAPRESVEIRDTATLKVAQALADPSQPRVSFSVAGMVFADGGKTLALGNDIGLIETIPVPHRIHFWDVKTGKILRKIELKGGAPFSLDVSPDGKTLATVTADDGVSLRVFTLSRGATAERK